MKAFVRGGGYLLLFILMSVCVPYLFKSMPFVMLALLLILTVILIRQDMQDLIAKRIS